MSVTRYQDVYESETGCYCMREHPDGDYVLAADYDALEAKLAESEAKLAFYDEQHAVAMETVGRLSDELQQAQQEVETLTTVLRHLGFAPPLAPEVRARYERKP